MPFSLGATLVLSPKESLDLIWGGTTQVWNFFSRTGLQPAAAVYMAECSISGGDCEGWKASLNAFVKLRAESSFRIHSLTVGFPGKHILDAMMASPYGSRWLGVLATVSLFTNGYVGARCLHDFLDLTTSSATRGFVLGLEQCEKLWTLSREVFADSSYYYEFLKISSRCLQASNPNSGLIRQIFPTYAEADTANMSFLVAAYRIWELSQGLDTLNRKLWAKGSFGISQLIFYLTVVSGFCCTVNINDSEPCHFGKSDESIKVVIDLDEKMGKEWKTGYYLDRMTTSQVVAHLLGSPDNPEQNWQPGRAKCAERYTSMYAANVDVGNISDGEFLLTACNELKRLITNSRIATYISRYLADMVHHDSYTCTLSVHNMFVGESPGVTSCLDGSASKKSRRKRSRGFCQALAERTRRAIRLFAPGLIHKNHLEQLILDISNDAKAGDRYHLLENVSHGPGICNCESQDEFLRNMRCLVLMQHRERLDSIACQIFFGAQVEINARILRDIGPDYMWCRQSNYRPRTAGMMEVSCQGILQELARRIGGRAVGMETEKTIGLSVGSLIVGLLFNEDCPINQDPGFTYYIFPGAIESKDRRIEEVYERPYHRPSVLVPGDTILMAADGVFRGDEGMFKPSSLDQVVQLHGRHAELQSRVRVGAWNTYLSSISAVNNIQQVSFMHGCLGKCAAGNLNNNEVSRVEIVNPENQINMLSLNEVALPKWLRVARVCHDPRLQRAILCQPGIEKILMQIGTCVPCALRAARLQDVDMLFC